MPKTALKRVRVLDGKDIRPTVEMPNQSPRRAGQAIVGKAILDELMRVADFKRALFRRLVLHAQRNPYAILIGQARRAMHIVRRCFVVGRAEAQFNLIVQLVIGAHTGAPGVLPLKLKRVKHCCRRTSEQIPTRKRHPARTGTHHRQPLQFVPPGPLQITHHIPLRFDDVSHAQ